MASIEDVHILDRFAMEFKEYLLIEEIAPYLIAEGVLSGDDYLLLNKCTPQRRKNVELMQLIKSKGPDCMQRFLHALYRSCTELSTPHQNHFHLWELLQTNINVSDAYPLKKQKSKSHFKRKKSSKSNKVHIKCSLMYICTHNIASTTV